jgi:hypothetical protein
MSQISEVDFMRNENKFDKNVNMKIVRPRIDIVPI